MAHLKSEDSKKSFNKEDLTQALVNQASGKIVQNGMKYGMNKLMRIIFLQLLFFAGLIEASDKYEENLYLLAHFQKSEYVRDNSYKRKNGDEVIAPATYQISFKIVKDIHKSSYFGPEVLQFNINIRDDFPFTLIKNVLLVVKPRNDGSYKLLTWDFIGHVFCIEQKFIPIKSKELYFKNPQKGNRTESCRFIKILDE